MTSEKPRTMSSDEPVTAAPGWWQQQWESATLRAHTASLMQARAVVAAAVAANTDPVAALNTVISGLRRQTLTIGTN